MLKGSLLVLLGGVFWGFSGVCGQYLFDVKGLNAHFLVPYRLFLAGLLCLGLCLIKSPNKGDLLLVFRHKKDRIRLLLFAIFGISLCQYTYFWGIELSNAAVATVIQYTGPVFVVLAVCILEKKMPSKIEALALFLVSVGTLLMATGGDFTRLLISPKALIICFISALALVCYTMLPVRINARYGAVENLSWAMLIGSVILGLWVLFAHGAQTFFTSLDLGIILAMLGVVVLGTAGAFSLFMLGLAIVGPSRASILSCIEPVACAAISFAWLGTKLGSIELAGFFAIILATVILVKK